MRLTRRCTACGSAWRSCWTGWVPGLDRTHQPWARCDPDAHHQPWAPCDPDAHQPWCPCHLVWQGCALHPPSPSCLTRCHRSPLGTTRSPTQRPPTLAAFTCACRSWSSMRTCRQLQVALTLALALALTVALAPVLTLSLALARARAPTLSLTYPCRARLLGWRQVGLRAASIKASASCAMASRQASSPVSAPRWSDRPQAPWQTVGPPARNCQSSGGRQAAMSCVCQLIRRLPLSWSAPAPGWHPSVGFCSSASSVGRAGDACMHAWPTCPTPLATTLTLALTLTSPLTQTLTLQQARRGSPLLRMPQ